MGDDEILVVRKKPGKDKLNVKVVKRMKNGYAPANYTKTVNFRDFNDLALLFGDLSIMFGAPVERAFQKYKEEKANPFWG